MTSNPSPKSRAGRPSATSREAILDTAIKLVEKEGEAGLSFRKIGVELGVSPAAIYGYFKDKQAIESALAQRLFDTSELDLDARYKTRGKIEKMLNLIRQNLLSNSHLLYLINKSLPAEQMLAILKTMSGFIEEAGLHHAKAARHAQSLLWMTLGFAMFEHNSREAYVVNRFTRINNLDSELLQHLDLENHDRLWRETVKRNLDGIGL